MASVLAALVLCGCRSSGPSSAISAAPVPARPNPTDAAVRSFQERVLAAEWAPFENPMPPIGEASFCITMSGDFRNPGRYAWMYGMTLKDGIDAAGGFVGRASRTVAIFHWDGWSARYDLTEGWERTNNPALEAGDSVREWRE
jgi:hypothetical protein